MTTTRNRHLYELAIGGHGFPRIADSEIENSFARGRDGVDVVSERSIYRYGLGHGDRPVVIWRAAYANSHIHKPGQLDAGSGTTPAILPGGYTAITDNADPMDVVVYRTAVRLRRGRRRLVCRVPVFHAGAGDTENSLIADGRSLIVENNYGYAGYADPDANAQTRPGFARVDIGRDAHGCHRVWQTDSLAAPSVVPKLSLKTVPTGEGTLDNNNHASLSLGPAGNAYLATIGGITELRRR